MTPTQTFEDGKGRKWELRITAGHAVDLKQAGININKALTDPSWISALLDDVGLLVAALHIVCKPDSKGISVEDFNEGLDGSALEAAAEALALAIIGFFPRSKIAGAMQKKVRETMAIADEEAVRKIEQMNPSTPSDSAGNSGES